MPDDDLSEWHRDSAEDSDEAMSELKVLKVLKATTTIKSAWPTRMF